MDEKSIELDVDPTSWVDRTETLEDVASASAVRQLAALLDRPIGADGIPEGRLFPLGHWLQFAPSAAQSELGTDGHPERGGFLPPITLPRRMWAGSKIAFHAPIGVGAKLVRTTTIESITPKKGASGELCFVILRHDVNADDVHALTEHQTVVYREAASQTKGESASALSIGAPSDAPSGWDWARTAQPDEVMLFRYSALTFNAHRIHYDRPYATEVEGYPGLVVHGPLSATLIVDGFLRERPDAQLTAFEFSARSPMFVNERLHVCGRSIGDGVEELAVVGPDEKVGIAARIEYRTEPAATPASSRGESL